MPEVNPPYQPIYTTYDDLFRLYGANKLTVRIGDDPADHISEDDVYLLIRDAERWVTTELSKCYAVPLDVDRLTPEARNTLANIALYRSAFLLWAALAGTQYTAGQMPDVVKSWDTLSRGMMADIVSGIIRLGGIDRVVGITIDIENREAIYGKVRGENKTIRDDEV